MGITASKLNHWFDRSGIRQNSRGTWNSGESHYPRLKRLRHRENDRSLPFPQNDKLIMKFLSTFLFSITVVSWIAISGCDSSSKETSPRPMAPKAATNRGTIGVSVLTLQNPFFKIIGDNITSEAKENGYDTIVVSADNDIAKQGNQVKDFIVRKVSAIVLSPCDPKSIVPIIQEANAAGIPVFTVDIPCPDPSAKVVTQIATDNYGGGKEAGKAMIEALGDGGGKVAIIHFKQAQSCILRVKGFREVIEEHNSSGKQKIDIVAELEGGGATDVGYRAAEDALQSHPDIQGIFAINDPSALGARAALEKANKADQIRIVGFDGMPEGKKAIKEGKIYADPIQFPEKMGIEIVRAFVRYSKGDELPPEILIPTSLYRKSDADQDPGLK